MLSHGTELLGAARGNCGLAGDCCNVPGGCIMSGAAAACVRAAELRRMTAA